MTGAIIQARMASTRLPSKVMLDLPFGSGIPLLEQIVRRAAKAVGLEKIVVATSGNPQDSAIAGLARKLNVDCFRGNENNVLERYYQCAKQYGIDTIVRLTGDSPFIDGAIIDRWVEAHRKSGNDYTGTELYPLGTNTEIFSFQALEKAYHNAKERLEKEHVSPYIRNNKDLFKIGFYKADAEHRKPGIRLTVDTIEDYTLACAVFDSLYPINPLFPLSDVIGLFEAKPWLGKINEKIIQKKVFTSLEEELSELKEIAKMQDLERACKFLDESLAEKKINSNILPAVLKDESGGDISLKTVE